MGVKSKPLEAHTRTQINTRLQNLGWILDENDPACNVFQERAKTIKQNTLFGKKRPDYVLYESNTDIPIAIYRGKTARRRFRKSIITSRRIICQAASDSFDFCL
jgi:type I restriction enzyme M protein